MSVTIQGDNVKPYREVSIASGGIFPLFSTDWFRCHYPVIYSQLLCHQAFMELLQAGPRYAQDVPRPGTGTSMGGIEFTSRQIDQPFPLPRRPLVGLLEDGPAARFTEAGRLVGDHPDDPGAIYLGGGPRE